MIGYIYEIVLVASTVVATSILTVVGFLLWRRTRTLPTALVALGFLVAVIGWLLVNFGPTETTYQYAEGVMTGAMFRKTYLFDVGRLFSAVGFIVGAAGLLWQVLSENRTAK
jgi:uncharacterized membrane protein